MADLELGKLYAQFIFGPPQHILSIDIICLPSKYTFLPFIYIYK